MEAQNNLYGLVACGGQSIRMGRDKAFLIYHQKPQCFHVSDLLKNAPSPLCSEVLICCNELQKEAVPKEYNPLVDLPDYNNNGPIASLLTAVTSYPQQDFLVVACDYPLLTKSELQSFLHTIRRDKIAATFYNNEDKYEPLIGWYSKECAPLLMQFHRDGNRSLQHFLRIHDAEKYYPENTESMTSVDTPEAWERIRKTLNKQLI
jgi:molybdopterin-guanine dinucleotide biosynthesis protein A